jgi:rare lipoprotein A
MPQKLRAVAVLAITVGALLPVLFSGCTASQVRRQRQLPAPVLPSPPAPPRIEQRGIASWYGPGFQGRSTASGEHYNQDALTAAHRTLPLGSQVEVTNLANGQSVWVRINDRGPFVRGRVIDLSRGAARKIGMMKRGVSRVQIQRLSAQHTQRTRLAATRLRDSSTKRAARVPHTPMRRARSKSFFARLWPF